MAEATATRPATPRTCPLVRPGATARSPSSATAFTALSRLTVDGPPSRRLLIAVLLVGALLIALSAAIDSPATNAAPELFGGAVALVAGASIARFAGTDQRLLLAAGVCLFVGGIAVFAVGLTTLDVLPALPWLELVGDAALVAGLAGFLYWRYGDR